MTDHQRLSLYRRLRRGETSRNREYDRFAAGEGRQVLLAFHRLASLIRDLGRSGARVRARWARNPGGLQVAVEVPQLRYRRVVLLAPWEAEALRAEVGGVVPFPTLPPSPPTP